MTMKSFISKRIQDGGDGSVASFNKTLERPDVMKSTGASITDEIQRKSTDETSFTTISAHFTPPPNISPTTSQPGGNVLSSELSPGSYDFYEDGHKFGEPSFEENRLDFTNLKLTGRDEELQVLHDVYSHVNRKGVDENKPRDLQTETSVAIIRGLSGTGKSTLVNQFIEDLNKKSMVTGGPTKPFFLSGKYDELSGGDDPFSAIVEAFSGFAQSLLLDLENQGEEAQTEVKRIREAITTDMGSTEARVMATMVPSLRKLIISEDEDESPAETVPSDNAWNRLKYIFQVFSNAISTANRPVVMFLDDLQWGDSASLELLEALLTDKDLRYFMFIGAYRSNEVQPGDELLETISAVEKVQGVKNVELTNLSLQELNEFIADALRIEENRERAVPLTEIVHDKTSGNIFFAVQVLEELQRKNLLLYSRDSRRWEFNLEDVHNLDDLVSDDVVAAVTSKIKSAPDLLQKAIVLMSYLKSSVDMQTIQSLLEMDGYTLSSEKLEKLLETGVLDGLLTNRMGSQIFSLSHDRIQQAAKSMIPDGSERAEFRFKLGRRLYKIGCSDSSDKNWLLFVAADHLNATCMQVKSVEKDALFLTKINLKAGTRAASVAAFETAARFLGLAMAALMQRVKDPWENEYDITLKVYEGIVSAELCQGHFEVGHGIAAKVLENAREEDKLPTLIALTKALGRSAEYAKGHELSGAAVRDFGLIPKSFFGRQFRMIKDLKYIKQYFKTHSDEDILQLPVVKDEKLISKVIILASFAGQAYYCNKPLESLAANLRQLRLTMKHGLFSTSATSIQFYCLFNQAMNDKSAVERFSRLAAAVSEKVESSKEVKAMLHFLSSYCIHAWKDRHEKVFTVYERGEKAGMESGDFENGLLCPLACNHYKAVSGFPLEDIDWQYTNLMQKLRQYKVTSMALIGEQQQLFVQQLIGVSKKRPNFKELSAPWFAESSRSGNDNYPIIFGSLGRIQLGVHFGEYKFAESMIGIGSTAWEMDEGYSVVTLRLYLSAIVYATLARKAEGQKKVQKSYLKKARNCSKELKAICKLKGMKAYHRHLLAEAQIAAADGSGGTVPKRYETALVAALKSGHINDAAIGGQLAAEYFLDMNDDSLSSAPLREAKNKLVRQNLTQARDLYLKWGAKGVVSYLETKYKKYLEPTVGLFDEELSTIDGDTCALTINSFGDEENYGVGSVVLPRSVVGTKADDVSVLSGVTGVTGLFTGPQSSTKVVPKISGASNFHGAFDPIDEGDGFPLHEDTGWD